MVGAQLARLLLCFITLGLAGCDRDAPQKPSHTGRGTAAPAPFTTVPARPRSLESGYAALASKLADPLMLSARDAPVQKETAQLVAEATVRVVEYQSIASPSPLVSRIAADAAAALDSMAHGWQHIESLNQDDGFTAFATCALGLCLHSPKTVIAGAADLLTRSDAKQQARIDWAAAFNRCRAAQLMLPAAAREYAGPAAPGVSLLAVDFDEAWANMVNHDSVVLTNTAGHRLTHCTVLVELHGRDGDVRQNVHYVEDWEPGGPRHADYGIGVDTGGVVYGRQTVYGAQDLRVSVWADEASQEGVLYHYAGTERDRDIRAVMDTNLKLIYDYRQSPLLALGPAAYITLDGLAWLPPHRVTLTFKRSGGTAEADRASFFWDMPEWTRGQKRTYDTHHGFAWTPDSFEAAISFPDNGCVWKQSVPLKHP